MDPITQLVNGIIETFRANTFLALLTLAFIICGAMFMLGNHERAKEKAQWVFVGAAVILGAKTLVTMVQGFVH